MALPLNRRQLLRIGGLSVLGLPSLVPAQITNADDSSKKSPASKSFGQARSCIFMLLQGGPSHLDLWDPKPQAPAEIRGPFHPIATNAQGIEFCEPLPRTGKIADRLTIVRSVTHAFNNHIAGTYVTLTGSNDQPNQDREAKADDFPGPGAVLNYLQSEPRAVPTSVSLPTWLSIPGPSNRMPGQYGGLLGSINDPFLISGEPHKEDFRPLSLSLPEGLGPERMRHRWSLHQEIDSLIRSAEDRLTQHYNRLSESAYQLLIDQKVRDALDLSREPAQVRDRYGRTKIGQSLLLARRLVEAGVCLVAYNAFNQEWDTHGGLVRRYQNLIPPMDQAFSALVEDLASRGLLESTLVINTGEFGRTPIINKDAGRDHWPDVYSIALAGGGIRGGLVYGASDNKGGYVADKPVAPADMLATMWHLLGVPEQTTLRDRLGRPIALTHGRVMYDWLS